MSKEIRVSDRNVRQLGPAGLAGEYLRSFAGAVRKIDAFDDFFEALSELVRDDPYLAGSASLSDYFKSSAELPNFEEIDSEETIVSVSGAAGNAGYLKYQGRRDGAPFGAQDLHLMGAIAGFIAVLTAQANRFRKHGESARVFQYLINQLPLCVVCFGADGDLLVQSKSAKRLLGEDGESLLKGFLAEDALKKEGRIRLHLEVGDCFLFAEGRRLQVDSELSITAFVIHDMSGQREKLMLQLERSAYRAESHGTALTLALLEDRSGAGILYRALKGTEASLQLSVGEIQSIDAYTCACVFPEKSVRSVKYLLRNTLPASLLADSTHASLVSEWESGADDSPAKHLMEKARTDLQPIPELLRPVLLVMDPYAGVIESLEVTASDVSRFQLVEEIEVAVAAIESGRYDGIFFDVDSYSEQALEELQSCAESAGAGFRIYYVSHMQPSMVYAKYGFDVDSAVFQKPFDAVQIHDSLALQFNFA